MFVDHASQSGDNTFVRPTPLRPAPKRDPYEQWHRPPLTIPPANDNNPLPKLVALAGVAGSGKSTVAEHLVAQYGYTRLKFAGPLKDMCRAIGMTEAMIEGAEKETPIDWLCGRTPRYVMQRLGTEFGRDLIGADFWVRLFQRQADAIITNGGRIVVDDCRFDNEAAAVQAMGGIVIRLVGRGGLAGNHQSEQITDEADAIVHNDGTIGDLHHRVREALLCRL